MGEGLLGLYPSLGNYWQWMLGELLSLVVYPLGRLPDSRRSFHTYCHMNNLGETQSRNKKTPMWEEIYREDGGREIERVWR